AVTLEDINLIELIRRLDTLSLTRRPLPFGGRPNSSTNRGVPPSKTSQKLHTALIEASSPPPILVSGLVNSRRGARGHS
ncbi:MAG: hypothetical protein ACREX9_11430, partial [Gammaproteobacteria bacterium]